MGNGFRQDGREETGGKSEEDTAARQSRGRGGREDGYTTVFSAAKWLSADVYRGIGGMAGCRVYEDEGDFVFANDRFLTIHAKTAGQKTIRFKRPCDPWEVYERKSYGEGVKEITVRMVRGGTMMFSLTGEV